MTYAHKNLYNNPAVKTAITFRRKEMKTLTVIAAVTMLLVSVFSLVSCGQTEDGNGFVFSIADKIDALIYANYIEQNQGGNGNTSPSYPDQDILVVSLTNGLNVRSGKGTSYSSLGTLDKGDMVAYMGIEDGWYKTVYREKTAYVSASSAYTALYRMDKASAEIEKVISIGKTLLGHPYVWGSQRYHWGNGVLNKNFVAGEFDCSALTQYVYYKGAGVLLDVTTRTQVLQGVRVTRDNLKRGDLMFFTNSSRYHLTGTERVGHVAIYLGDNYILHTASDHAVIEQISSKRWSYFIEGRRVLS